MTVSKKQLSDGIVKFIETDLIPNIGDRNMKFVLAIAKDSLREDDDLIDVFLRSPMVATLIKEEEDDYDITQFSTILKNVLSEYQTFSITIPKIPLFSPTEKVLKITAEDVDRLMKYFSPQML